jgi:hypothetical protein
MTTGDPMTTCPWCGYTYYTNNGHICTEIDNITHKYYRNEPFSFNQDIILENKKLLEKIEQLEKIICDMGVDPCAFKKQ